MLSTLARAPLRRAAAVSLPLRPLTARVEARAPIAVSAATGPALRTQPFSSTSWAGEAAKSKATKKKTVKKTTKKAAAAKPKPKPKKKKELTPEEKAKKEVKELRAKALLTEPKKLPDSKWLVYITQELKGTFVGGDLPGKTAAVSQAFKALSTFELERLQEKADANRLANVDAYKAWVESHTAQQIHEANLARARLNRKHDKSHRKISDDRQPKRPSTAYSLYVKARWASGEVSAVSAAEASKGLAAEWKGLSESEKQVYHDQAATEAARYAREKASFDAQSA
ncbi:unnamed protein product [Parascedosporium putredinis]|uniref:HMG box domain-containing protein n=1 Tax=Parascedosporium putredinis TaxID=1442378 RepID=A0A9P1H7E5_9PEZI|nr:unnamed protein product [Parascedosporium putredinis]CAI7998576.1 unnamed protein product [Parascedosporium putredinis]